MAFNRIRKFLPVVRGLAFLSPNIAGFLMFTLVPLALSFIMAFTNWDLQQHNRFQDESIRFVGLANFQRLLMDPAFWQYLGNTFFLMLVIPFGIAGSLVAALLLHRNPQESYRGSMMWIWGSGILLVSCWMLASFGMRSSAMMLLISGLVSVVLISGIGGGTTTYRTLFYLPHFTQGVAVFILWKKLYNPTSGPINTNLEPVVSRIESIGVSLPSGFSTFVLFIVILLLAAFWLLSFRSNLRNWIDGEWGSKSFLLAQVIHFAPLVFVFYWLPGNAWGLLLFAIIASGAIWIYSIQSSHERLYDCESTRAIGSAMLSSAAIVTLQLIVLGLGLALFNLPQMSREGLEPPLWLADYHWAKPSLMIISLWAAIGSNNMILYLAGLSNIPQELYEASDIDGAGRWQKFIYITWPQLAPVTFFIVVMSFIYGLQGGFEMARTMTGGGPAGSTTTLSYYVYSEGFETGRLGYASAVAWVLFIIVFIATMFNWRFGNRYVNE